jgi:E3 ubiquitin-protein ligase UBR4
LLLYFARRFSFSNFAGKREEPSDGEELCVEADGGLERGDRLDLLHLSRGISIPAHKSKLVLTMCSPSHFHLFNVLAIYTYTKRVNLDDFDMKQRKSQGYSTVSHFNVVHVDCHLAAVR